MVVVAIIYTTLINIILAKTTDSAIEYILYNSGLDVDLIDAKSKLILGSI